MESEELSLQTLLDEQRHKQADLKTEIDRLQNLIKKSEEDNRSLMAHSRTANQRKKTKFQENMQWKNTEILDERHHDS
eukprot:UN02104